MSPEKKMAAVLVLVSLVLIGVGLNKQSVTLPGIANQVERTLPTVVHISKVGEWQGSGCIVSADGVIFTAKHVVEGGGTFEVTLNDGRKFKTTKALADKKHDIGFLKIDVNTPLPCATLATMDAVRVGDPVFVAGSPLGIENFNSVTLGTLSCKQRPLSGPESEHYGWGVTFQSDASAYPGNSGGPVFNIKGEVIGVLVAGVGPGLNYSVPIEVCKHKWTAVSEWFALMELEVVEPPSFNLTEDEWAQAQLDILQLSITISELQKQINDMGAGRASDENAVYVE
jgi:S1-C subfamily serine protease